MSPTTPDLGSLPGIPGLELCEQIGEGGAGVVYKAVHRALQRTVAVKLLPPVEAGSVWLREPRLMAALVHPHVVAVHDAGQSGGHGYLVLEYMAGGSLRGRMLPGEPWLLADAVILLDRVAAALEYIHKQGVLHLDLKPENILYTADGQAKVADFGLSVPHDASTAPLGGQRFRGTIDYCAPETRTGLGLDARCDVFSLATLADEILFGWDDRPHQCRPVPHYPLSQRAILELVDETQGARGTDHQGGTGRGPDRQRDSGRQVARGPLSREAFYDDTRFAVDISAVQPGE